MSTALDVMKIALGELRVLRPGEVPSSDEQDDLIMRLNAALETWAASDIIIYSMTDETRSLTTGDESFTIGSTGDWAVTRPTRVIRAFIRDSSGNDSPLEIIGKDRYDLIADKTPSNSQPGKLCYDPTYPNGTLYIYPPPTSGWTLHLIHEKPFTAFTDANTSFSFPPGYLEFMGYNFALRLAGPYNKTLSASTIAIAQQTKNSIEARNTSENPIRGTVSVPAGSGSGYNIVTDEG